MIPLAADAGQAGSPMATEAIDKEPAIMWSLNNTLVSAGAVAPMA